MAIFFSSSQLGSSWILSFKMLLASATVLSVAWRLKTSVPVITDFVVTEIPTMYDFMLSWLRPPYLYLLINCIIISIVASSKLQHKVEEAPAVSPSSPPSEPVNVSGDVRVEYSSHGGLPAWSGNLQDERLGKVSEFEVVFGGAEVGAVDIGAKKVEDDEVQVLRPMNLPERNDSTDFWFLNLNEKEEKPPASKRFPPRKSVKSNPEGKALGVVSKPKRHDTLESTWKAITDGRAVPLTRHLRKSDTWDRQLRLKKCETFSDGSDTAGAKAPSLSPSPGSGKLRKEPSLSQEELNRRVEAFIKKFNEEMRLQRQESLNQYQEMIRRGAV